MTHRSVSFAPTELFKSHFPRDVDAQTKAFLQETWQERLQQKREVEKNKGFRLQESSINVDKSNVEFAIADVHEPLPCEKVHPQEKTYSEKEVKSAFYVGVVLGAAAALLFLWLHPASA